MTSGELAQMVARVLAQAGPLVADGFLGAMGEAAFGAVVSVVQAVLGRVFKKEEVWAINAEVLEAELIEVLDREGLGESRVKYLLTSIDQLRTELDEAVGGSSLAELGPAVGGRIQVFRDATASVKDVLARGQGSIGIDVKVHPGGKLEAEGIRAEGPSEGN